MYIIKGWFTANIQSMRFNILSEGPLSRFTLTKGLIYTPYIDSTLYYKYLYNILAVYHAGYTASHFCIFYLYKTKISM